jgi:hypothetical protein
VYCNLLAAAVFTLPALITGLLAWQWKLEGERLALHWWPERGHLGGFLSGVNTPE